MPSIESLPDDDRTPTAAPGTVISLAAIVPEILATVPVDERRLAAGTLVVPRVSARDGDLADVIGAQIPGAFDFLIVDGVVLKETMLAGRTALELLGPGDLLAPPLTEAGEPESRAIIRYIAHGQVSLAALESRFRLVTRRWPGVAEFVCERLGRQTRHASLHLAMLHLPRIEDRLMALFADLAERFGRVSASGVLIDLPLTHQVIGGLVAGRRPTVSLALRTLASNGQLERLDDGRWRLAPGFVSPPVDPAALAIAPSTKYGRSGLLRVPT